MTERAVRVSLLRIIKHLPPGGAWLSPAWQGPAGLYAVRGSSDQRPSYQVVKVQKVAFKTENVSEPFLTTRGAQQFARRLAEGAPSGERFESCGTK